jgi:hypothetical protein
MLGATWRRITIAALGLVLLGVAGQARGGPGVFCCRCLCSGQLSCEGVTTPSQCPSACPGVGCTFEVLPGECGPLASECEPPTAAAPALGPGTLIGAALVLAAVGWIGMRSRRPWR